VTEALRFLTSAIGLAAAFLYLLAAFFWQGSWLAEQFPWARYVPIGLLMVFTIALAFARGIRLHFRTLPGGGPDLFFERMRDFRFRGNWDAAFFLGLGVFVIGWFTGWFVSAAGFCLVNAGSAQAHYRVYEEDLPQP
jgi:hypothetical protein